MPSTLAEGDGILIVDADLTIVQANLPMQSLLRMTPEELRGADASRVVQRHLAPLLPEDGAPGQIVALLEDGPCPPLTLDLLIPGPGVRRVSVTASTVETATLALRLLVFHDTGEGYADPARSTHGESSMAIFAQDRDLRYLRVCNPEGPALLPDFAPGKTDADIFCPEEAARLTGLKRRVLETGKIMKGELPLTVNGAVRTLELTLMPMRDSDGGIYGIWGVLLDVTDRRRAIEALATSERQLATLMSNLRGMAYRCWIDRGWTMEFVSEGAKRITGYAPGDLVGNRRVAYGDLIHPDDRERVWQKVTAGIAVGKPFQMTYRLITASGEERWVWEQGRGVPGPRGGVAVAEGYITDITDRVRAEAALAESEERFRSIFSTSHAVMLIIDPKTGAIVDANPAASAYYGYPLDTLTAMRITDINTLEPDEVLREIRKATDGGERHFSFRHRLADGQVRDVDVFSGRVVIHDRALLHSIIHDVTERRRAEEQFRALLDATPDAALLIDHGGTILALNEVMAARFNKSVGELLGACIYDLLPPELAAVRRDAVEQVLTTGKPLQCVDERVGMVLENIVFPISGGREDTRRVAIISRDVTRQREFEQIRQEAFDRIEQNIEQFAILSDHIRQPLQVILGMTCLLEDEKGTGVIQEEVRRINEYIRQLDQGWIESRKIRKFLRRHELV
ncbi:PAS domain S-box protein [Methanoculleus sp.]|uniref:PAS domain S-box protein n=1 Tax=Methanoculleus sp. TaxID=90427 RepID=UPI0025DE8DD9|nr:PAS domain S-box protein [Methanoculleus sp.]